MTTETAGTAAVRAPPTTLAFLREVVLLAKPRLSGLVVLTTTGGLLLAPGSVPAARAVLAVLATAAVVGAANALNCYFERETDALMRRTRDRPLPAGSTPSWRWPSASWCRPSPSPCWRSPPAG